MVISKQHKTPKEKKIKIFYLLSKNQKATRYLIEKHPF